MLKTTMKFRIIILFFLSLTLDSLAQRCGGHFNFRIYDQKSKVLTPSLADTIFYGVLIWLYPKRYGMMYVPTPAHDKIYTRM